MLVGSRKPDCSLELHHFKVLVNTALPGTMCNDESVNLIPHYMVWYRCHCWMITGYKIYTMTSFTNLRRKTITQPVILFMTHLSP